MDRVAILVPVLGRPHRVGPVIESVARGAAEAAVYFAPDPDDRAEIAELERVGANITVRLKTNYAAKVNALVRVTSEPYVFTGADDLEFHHGWLERAMSRMTEGIGVVGTNDLCNPRTADGTLSTHSLVARWYVDEHGTIDERGKLLHEGYQHEWVDDELVATAKARGMYAHAPDAIVEHLHPDVGKAPMDGLYALRDRRMRHGRALFASRRRLWARL